MSASTRKIFRVLLPLLIFIFLIIISIIIISSAPKPEKKEEEIKAPLVTAFKVTLENKSLVMNSFGVLKPKHQTSLIAQVSGQVTKISPVFASGGKVKEGDFLAQIDPSDYQAALIEAQANLQRSRAALDEEEARGIVAKKEWQGATSALPPALGLRKPQLAREQANLRSAQASLARAERNLSRTKIVAPYNALINKRNIDLGQFISLGTNLGEVSSIDIGEVRLPLSSSDYSYLVNEKNNSVILTRDENGSQQQWIAKIVRDEGVIDEQSRMIYLVAEIKNPYQKVPQLKFGTFVKAAIESKSHDNVAVIPSHLYRDGHVTLINDKREVHQQPVKVLKRDKVYVYIADGLNNDDLILDTKVEHLYEGMKVRLKGDKVTAVISNEKSDADISVGDK